MKQFIGLFIGLSLSLSVCSQSLGLQQLGSLGGDIISSTENMTLSQGMGSLVGTVIAQDSIRLDQGIFLACDLSCSGIKTGVEGFASEEMRIRVFPNPAHTILFVETADNQTFSYRLISPTGQIVQEGLLQQAQISIEFFPAGIYFLHLHRPDRHLIFSTKIIIQ